MSLAFKKVSISSTEFTLYRMKPRKVLRMQKPLARVIAPLTGALTTLLGGISRETMDAVLSEKMGTDALGVELVQAMGDGRMDMSRLVSAAQNALNALGANEQDEFICEMLSDIQTLKGSQGMFLNSGDAIDEVFASCPNDIYRLLFEVVKFNEMLPFIKASTGNQT